MVAFSINATDGLIQREREREGQRKREKEREREGERERERGRKRDSDTAWQKFSKDSSVLNLPCKMIVLLTLGNF